VEAEVLSIEAAVAAERALAEHGGTWADLFKPREHMLYRTMVGFTIQLLQQFSGINAVM
jgi:hypothetical protein